MQQSFRWKYAKYMKTGLLLFAGFATGLVLVIVVVTVRSVLVMRLHMAH